MVKASDGIVAAQLLAAAGLFWPGPPMWTTPGAVRVGAACVVVGGGLLAAAGGRDLGRDLTPFVDPRAGAGLRTGGSYAISRNPIYAGLLAAAVGVAVLRARPEPLIAAAALAAVLHVKTGLEEPRLRERFGAEYARYAARTPRLLGRRRSRS